MDSSPAITFHHHFLWSQDKAERFKTVGALATAFVTAEEQRSDPESWWGADFGVDWFSFMSIQVGRKNATSLLFKDG